ncbi:SDR family oxidoreductase [Fonticella tunisiensis]|uniref:UDP-glucose 4-epimerase n=1 Tax=Fonticella tunisiensis TaxID=1096341 RepID=A0A4V3ES30_9CLOT|nr:SDR family oxidoreductase [Fonticella tunisiensis]TDT52010.1 UDP-glucose 4-epimerase [Fonticella tunisiensis]
MKVLVTGGAGFIGSNIVDRLIELNHDVAVVDNLSTGRRENLNPGAEFYNVDIVNKEDLTRVFEAFKPEICIHHAAQIDVQRSIKEPDYDADVNIVGTINVLNACRLSGARKIIYASSAAVYGEPEYLPLDENHKVEPISYYGVSKHTPEHYIKIFSQLYGLRYTILRYSNVYGIRQDPMGEGGVIAIFLNKLVKGEVPTIFGDGEQTRDFIYVKDVVEANIAALTRGDGYILNISTNTCISINDLVKKMIEASGRELKPNYGPARKGDIIHSYMDNRRAAEVLGWEPRYGLVEGLRETYEYYSGR